MGAHCFKFWWYCLPAFYSIPFGRRNQQWGVLLSGCKSCATTEHGFSSGFVAVVSVRQSGIHVKGGFSSPQGFDQIVLWQYSFHQFEFRMSILGHSEPFSQLSGRRVGKNNGKKKEFDDRNEPEHEIQLNIWAHAEMRCIQTKKFLAERVNDVKHWTQECERTRGIGHVYYNILHTFIYIYI